MFTLTGWKQEFDRLTGRISDLENQNANLHRLGEVIKRNNALFEALLANSREGVLLTGIDRRIIRVIHSIAGHQNSELCGALIESVVHVEDHPIIVDCYQRLLTQQSQGVEFEVRVLRPDGGTVWVSGLFTDMLDDQNVQAVVCNYSNSGQQKHRDQIAAEFANLANRANYAIFSQDVDGSILTWNAGAQRQFGYAPEEIIGAHIHVLVPAELQDTERKSREQITHTKEPCEIFTQRMRKDGSKIGILLNLQPLVDRYGRTYSIVHASRVLTASGTDTAFSSLPDFARSVRGIPEGRMEVEPAAPRVQKVRDPGSERSL